MGFICRIKEVKPNNFIHHFKRYYFQIPTPRLNNQTALQRLRGYHFLANTPEIRAIYQHRENLFNFRVRFFAAPVQIKKKEEVANPSRPRINEEIKAQFLRLVTDEGHSVISRHEALSRAKNLELDLVEVDRDAKPPVCKILDYHRERYKKQVKEKERAKLKAAGSLRRGTCKEVRISAKTELKDLKLKADTVMRLMERGYRVKCTVTGSEDQDLSGLLSQLSELIEDVAFVEFGPKIDTKQAHLVVRHIKFGTGKKGGKKAPMDKTAVSPEIHNAASAPDSGEPYDEESGTDNDDAVEAPSWSVTAVSSADQNLDKMFDLSHDVRGPTSSHGERVPNFTDPNVGSSVSQATENRYARSASKNASAVRNPMRFPNNGTQPLPQPQPQLHPHPHRSVPPRNGPRQSHPNVPPLNRPQQSGREGSPPRNFNHPPNDVPRPRGEIPIRSTPPNSSFSGPVGHRQPPSNAGGSGSQSTGFGIFSTKVDSYNPNSARPDAARIPCPGVVPGNLNPPTLKSDGPQKPESADKKFGIFSR